MGQLKGIVREVIQDQVPPIVNETLDVKLAPLKRDIRKIKKDGAYVVNILDKSDIELRKRLTRVERHTGLT